jgi:hypothetical protein
MENITVCLRVRPNKHSDESIWKIDSNVIQSVKSKEIFTYGKLNLKIFLII